MVFPEPFDVRTDSGGDISLDRGAICMDQIDIPRRLEGLEKWWRSTSPSLAKENITAAEEEDSGFGEAWREVLTKYLCKSLHRVMRRRSYQ